MKKEEKIQVLKDFSAGKASINQVILANQKIKGEVVVLHTFFDILK